MIPATGPPGAGEARHCTSATRLKQGDAVGKSMLFEESVGLIRFLPRSCSFSARALDFPVPLRSGDSSPRGPAGALARGEPRRDASSTLALTPFAG